MSFVDIYMDSDHDQEAHAHAACINHVDMSYI